MLKTIFLVCAVLAVAGCANNSSTTIKVSGSTSAEVRTAIH